MPDIDDTNDYGYDPAGDAELPLEQLQLSGTPPRRHVIAASKLPPVGRQGTAQHSGAPPTCTAWASTYGLASAAAARAGGYAPHSADRQASPAYIYVQVVGLAQAPCKGSSFTPYFKMLAAQGTPTLEAAPYTPDCTTLVVDYHDPTNPPPMASAFQRPVPRCISAKKDVQVMKHMLAADRPLVYGTRLYTDWAGYPGSPVPYVGNGTMAKAKHCMMIIGYDDDMGAWRLQNSEGEDWGDHGYVWIAYDTFAALAEGTAFFYE